MTKYLPKAERMFQQKLKTALAPQGYVHNFSCAYDEIDPDMVELWDEDDILIRHWRADCFDFNYIAELFNIYGCYLLLIEDEHDQAESIGSSSPTSGLSGLVYPPGAHRNLPREPENSLSDSGEEWYQAEESSKSNPQGEGTASQDQSSAAMRD